MSQVTPFLPVDMSGKRVVVTAGGKGIGRRIAEAYSARGAAVFICDIDEAAVEDARSSEHRLFGCVADVSDVGSVDEMFDLAEVELGGFDVLVNNAGIAGPTSAIDGIDPEDLRRTLATDVESMFYCARRVVPGMRKAQSGCILNLGSIAGRLSFAMRTPYATAKWGVVGLTKSMALELGPDRIRVNAILPGHVNTSRFQAVVEAKAAAVGLTPEEVRSDFLSVVAMQETVETEDIANMALYLSSPFGAALTGQAISVCKGVEMMR